MDKQDTIVAVSTAVGEGGIGIVRMSGCRAVAIADKIFFSHDKKKPSDYRSHTIHYGRIIDNGKRPRAIDEVLLTVMKAPRTYTKEDIVEVNCHGGPVAVKKVVELAVRKGGRLAEPGEFTKRAFLNGRIDLAQAEAVADIVRARTDEAMRIAVGQLEGGLSRVIKSAAGGIVALRADIEAYIDFPDEDIPQRQDKAWLRAIRRHASSLEKLAATYERGIALKEGVTAVICGRTNVGKSSLMNCLLGADRVIVTPVHGTTRDAVEDMVDINGVPVRLIDTAGIRMRHGAIEKEGIKKARRYILTANLILCVLDGSERLKKDDIDLLKNLGERSAMLVVNKCDLRLKLDVDKAKKISGDMDMVRISCLAKSGLDLLERKIYNKVWARGAGSFKNAVLNNLRHKDALKKAVAALNRAWDILKARSSLELAASDLKECADLLGEITGETYTDDILDIIFSKFCIGK